MQEHLREELARGLRLLEGRLQLLRVRSRRVDPTEWDALQGGMRGLVPEWLRTVVEQFALVNAVLEIRDPADNRARLFSFYSPADYRVALEDGSLWREVMHFGYFPFANEEDGNAWVVEVEQGSESTVHLLELSAWGGGVPTAGSGLQLAGSRLELLLCHMAVSAHTYGQTPGAPRWIKWFPSE